MRVLIQRSLNSNVKVNDKLVGSINYGLVLFVGFTHNDNIDTIKKIVKKIINLRIFDDENHIMNKSVLDVGGSILSISQFTLYADCKKGNRPSYINAMEANKALELYKLFNNELNNYVKVETGIFREDMLVSITNSGPVTILLESE